MHVAPALPMVEYETKTFDGALDTKNKYRGRPNKQLDDAWHEISMGEFDSLLFS
jgi:hypothetical protein